MINFDYQILKTFLKENLEFLTGARIQKIQQPTRQELIFAMRNSGESRKFYINIHPNFFHVCFISKENEQKRNISIPQAPPMFCMLLRKYLEGAKIVKVEQPEGERILEFYFETYNELSEKIFLCLAIELMGKHSNVVLYNYDTNVIIGCAHNVGEDKSRERHLVGGLPYAYPLRKNNVRYFGLSNHFEESDVFKSLSVNESIDNYFATLQEEEKTKAARQKISSFVGAKLKKINNSLLKLNKQTKTKDKAELYRKTGDLIMANLYANRDFSAFIEVFDYENNTNLKIDLDETKTLKENANSYYKLYAKAKTAALKSGEQIELLGAEKDYLEQVLYSLESSEGMADLLEIQEEFCEENKFTKSCHPELVSGSNQRKNAGKMLKRVQHDIRENIKIVKADKFTVYVGKNNKQNDYIVSKLARDEDWWFHVRLGGGSHVLLKIENHLEPDEKTIFECAKLAKQHSRSKGGSKVGVIYTKAKYLKKPPCAKLGYVTYKNEKEIIID